QSRSNVGGGCIPPPHELCALSAARVLGVLPLPGAAELRHGDISPHVGPGHGGPTKSVKREADVIAKKPRALLAARRGCPRPEPNRVVRVRKRGRDGLVCPARAVVRRGRGVEEVFARALGALFLVDDADLATSGRYPREPLVGQAGGHANRPAPGSSFVTRDENYTVVF